MKPNQAQQFGAYIRRAREEQGLSARALARLIGVNDTTILRIEQGAIEAPRPDLLTALARELDLPLSDVFAMADYVAPRELPNFAPYLRAKYGDLPASAMKDLERSFRKVAERYGYEGSGPKPGEDES